MNAPHHAVETKKLIVVDGKPYECTFDEYGVLNTVHDGRKLLSTKNRAVQRIINNADAILSGRLPNGMRFA